MTRAALALVLFASAARADEPARVVVAGSKALPPVEGASVYKAGAVKSGAARPKPLLAVPLDTPTKLPGDGPFDIYARPKGGGEVLVASGVKGEAGKTVTVKLAERLGTIDVFRRDDSPRVGRIVVTDPFDAGPDEKGHVPVQSAPDFRVEMLVPEGDYAVWVVPENGARAFKAADRVRVLAGRIVRVD